MVHEVRLTERLPIIYFFKVLCVPLCILREPLCPDEAVKTPAREVPTEVALAYGAGYLYLGEEAIIIVSFTDYTIKYMYKVLF
jgi:hypothetical protein